MKGRKVWIVEETSSYCNKSLCAFSSKKKALAYMNCIADYNFKDDAVIVDNVLGVNITITSKSNKNYVVKYTLYYLIVK